MEPIHPLGSDDGFENPLGTTVSFSAEVHENPATSIDIAPEAFRWYEEDSCDDLADEILAWASAEEPESLRMGVHSDSEVPPRTAIRN